MQLLEHSPQTLALLGMAGIFFVFSFDGTMLLGRKLVLNAQKRYYKFQSVFSSQESPK